jgi:hypothetical protein
VPAAAATFDAELERGRNGEAPRPGATSTPEEAMTEGPTPIPEPAPEPTAEAAAPPAREPSRRSRGPLLVAGVVGALLGAAVVGILWLALGGDDDGDVAAADATPLAAPTALGAYVPIASAPRLQDERGQGQIERISRLNQRTAQQVSEAFGGAGAVAATYVDDELLTFVPLVAVRAQAPLPWVPYQDPADLHLVRAPQEVLRFGDVACVVQNQPTPEGGEPAEDSVVTTLCSRTGPGLTVQVLFPGSDLGHQPARVAQLVDEAWASLGGAEDT